ncbi:MAG: 1-acyl-sn-glycerol-3-phosphate acyltransferase [Clostridia bacterium]|nr:1-acyl-sn-glycerol-3-phosphate acyltransferase [Clostridia bacterium]
MRVPLWVRVAKRIVYPFLQLLFPYRVIGRENIPPAGSGGLILCCNHISLADPLFLMIGQKRHVFFMGKEELFRHRLAAWFFRQVGVFSVSRGKGDTGALDEAEHILREGEIMGIFPEGTRSKTGELLRFKSGAAVLAAKTQMPVLPACVMTKNQKVKPFRRTTVVFGTPLSPEALSLTGEKPNLRAATRTMMAAVQTLMEDNR